MRSNLKKLCMTVFNFFLVHKNVLRGAYNEYEVANASLKQHFMNDMIIRFDYPWFHSINVIIQ